jgi:hypothetical protein
MRAAFLAELGAGAQVCAAVCAGVGLGEAGAAFLAEFGPIRIVGIAMGASDHRFLCLFMFVFRGTEYLGSVDGAISKNGAFM